ncbi:hypothetical protein IPJ91_01230 [bacterium]|nr:MAG: hypothetical protein IPJ91_01230 [bacterium]
MSIFLSGCNNNSTQKNEVDIVYQAINMISSNNNLVNKTPSELYELLNLSKDIYKITTHSHSENYQNLQISVIDKKIGAYDLAKKMNISNANAYEVNAEHSIWVIGSKNEPFESYNGLNIDIHITYPSKNSIKGSSYSGNTGSLKNTYIDYIYINIPE